MQYVPVRYARYHCSYACLGRSRVGGQSTAESWASVGTLRLFSTAMASQRLTSALVDKRVAIERQNEAQQKSLTAMVAENSRQREVNRAETLVARKRRTNAASQAAAGQMLEDTVRAREKERADRGRLQFQNRALAEGMMRQRAAQERSEREIQRICEESEELRDLEAKLKVAYMNKERAMQLEERGMITEMEMRQEQAINDQMEYDRQQALGEMEANEIVRRQHMITGRHLLEEQMSQAAYNKMVESQQEAAADQKMVADVMRKIEQEDFAEYKEKQRKVDETVSAIQQYQVQREAEKAQAKADYEAEEARILAYAQAKGAREGVIKKQQDAKRASEEAKFKAIEAEMRRKQAEEEEFEELRSLMLEQETELRVRESERKEIEKRELAKREMMEANEQQKVLRKHIADQQRAEEEELRQLTLAKFQADVKLDQEAEERRQLAKKQYQSEIEEQARLRREAYELERAAEVEARRRLEEEEQFKKRVVEEARKRLLAEHVSKLDGYLPKGVLQSTSDLDVLGRR